MSIETPIVINEDNMPGSGGTALIGAFQHILKGVVELHKQELAAKDEEIGRLKADRSACVLDVLRDMGWSELVDQAIAKDAARQALKESPNA